MQLHQYIRITKAVADGARTEGAEEFANNLDERVVDAILCLPRRERVSVVMTEADE